jgi:glycosyltransferase involved in cell wall biosynthesis
MPDYFNSADIFVQGSHHEGGGFALSEALACGLVPVVPGIPAFRALMAGYDPNNFWKPGDAGEFYKKLSAAMSTISENDPSLVRAYFEANLSLPVVGARALQAYETILTRETY